MKSSNTPPNESPVLPIAGGEGFVKTEGESSEAHDDEALIPLRDGNLDDTFALEAEQKTEKKFMSIILTNLHINHEGWRAELPQKQEEEGEGERKALEYGTGEEDKEADVANEERPAVDSEADLHSTDHKVTMDIPQVTVEGVNT